jgi:hypothetical protein
MYRFKVGGEYYDAKGEGVTIAAGNFMSIAQAKRAAQAVLDFIAEPAPGKLPSDLEEIATVVEEGTLEIALYWVHDDTEEWLMTFDAQTGEPVEATPDPDAIWELFKKGLK